MAHSADHTIVSNGKLDFIDALRGYAIFMVMCSHVGNSFANLPWPVRSLTNYGFNGVQLFFVVSCVTLLKSWHSRAGHEAAPVAGFFIRRVFRILPMYALAAAFYLMVWPPGSAFSWSILATTLTFTNGWTPHLLGTDGSWVVVPGGWSITTEFSFYFLFPLLAMSIASLRRALGALAVLLLLSWGTAIGAAAAYMHEYGAKATEQFIFYWLPNQLPVFAVGFVTYYLELSLRNRERIVAALARWHIPIIFALLGSIIVLSRLPMPRIVISAPPFLPLHVLSALLFLVLYCALSAARCSIFVNRMIVRLGQVSFSAYLLHFAVIFFLLKCAPPGFANSVTGARAILCFLMLLAGTAIVTYFLCQLTYRGIEQPMIRTGSALAKWVNAGRRRGVLLPENAG